ncbi:gliding motility-associated C-terminal domain-containing protein [Dyadobacter subterraneus]|uniref:Gliding motility-associated C-terminal domain-containing protein n=1 Tax=Dyadobacter subterraneus TaxID=2773304 RepID=A0ABR9W6C7_9BACT|nr:gliding motility-associated C-terminal domain-containing protein [Dyadobacter subterraneus]MBE9460990.1 gliding motility-associated C-terminal domain-containing protein [Dyadobacter subterraneus]
MTKTIQFLLILVLVFLGTISKSFCGGMYFVQNKGQWDSDILFRTEIPGGFLFLKNKSIVYVLYDASKVSDMHGKATSHPSSPNAKFLPPTIPVINAHGVEVKFENAGSDIKFSTKNPVKTTFNYFLGNDKSKWVGNAGAFEELIYENIYKGIDLRFYIYDAKLKYEFIVHPQADASQIKLKYEGATDILVNASGQTIVKTSVGEFKEAQPYSFQTINNKTQDVASKIVLSEGNRVQFSLPKDYNHSAILTIDPELIFSTFSGSIADNWGHTATYDAQGNLYSGGTVFGASFPATVGAFQVKFAAIVDVGILKYTPDGSQLLYATYLGGNDTEVPNSLIVNSKNQLFIFGTTASTNFPVSTAAYQKVFGGGTFTEPVGGLAFLNGSDIFISGLSADGSRLEASTFIGGKNNDGISATDNVKVKNYGDSFRGEIELDGEDNIIIVSSTNSDNFPVVNADQTKLSGNQDGILFKISANLSNLIWSTYIGGSGFDAAFSAKPAKNGDVFVTGITQSADLKTQSTSYQPKLSGTEDAFIATYSDGRLKGMTYLGTVVEDGGYLLDFAPNENVYVYGLTFGKYPVSNGIYSNAGSGQFVHALDYTLSKSIFSTVIGSGRGVPDISPTAFLVSECGNIYLAGWGGDVNRATRYNFESSTSGLPVTENAIQTTTSGSNFYIAILEENAKSLLYGTFFGSQDRTGVAHGDHVDGGTSRFDKNGMIYHATCACGGSFFPTTPQAWSRTNKSPNCNNAAFKIDIDLLKADFDVYQGQTKNVLKGCAPLKLDLINTSEGGVEYFWDVNGNGISREEDGGSYTFTEAGQYKVTLTVYNKLSCKRMDVAQKIITVESVNAKITGDTLTCENKTTTLFASGGTKYEWSPATGLDNRLSATPKVTIDKTTTYSVKISTESGCSVTKKVTVSVEESKDFTVTPDVTTCAGTAVTLTISGEAPEYQWSGDSTLSETTGKSVSVSPVQTTTYTVQGIYANGCRPKRLITVNVDRSYVPVFEIVRSGGECNKPVKYSMMNKTPNAQRFEWNLGTSNFSTANVEDYSYETPGKYTVTLTSYNSTGCSLSTSKEISAEEPLILPNVITPNGDGKNDIFYVPVTGSALEIYNRWGKSIYKSGVYKNDWGKGITNGTYFYVVDTPGGNHCKGWLEVLE